MRIILITLLAGFPAAAPAPEPALGATPAELNDHGTFQILAAGKNIGTEVFEIRVRPAGIEAQGNVHLLLEQGGKALEVHTASTLLLDRQYHPVSYNWSQKGTHSSQLTIDFHADPAHIRYKTVGGQDDWRDFQLDKDVVVLDDNSIHHYQLAVARYDLAKGGPQTFHAFVPQEALPGVVTLNFIGLEPVTVNGEKRTLRHFLLATELAQITLWSDDQGHLQLVSAPGAQYEAIRNK